MDSNEFDGRGGEVKGPAGDIGGNVGSLGGRSGAVEGLDRVREGMLLSNLKANVVDVRIRLVVDALVEFHFDC